MPPASLPPNALTPPGPHLFPHLMPALSTRQSASVFNQPLSFDTSKVTNMGNMFYVRSARALGPSLESGHPRACRLRRRHPTPPGPYTVPLIASHARLSTLQKAYKFNQPLNFDTSKVTIMSFMFYVRSARALAPPQP